MATSTASFGAGKRESHDSSAFYARRMSKHGPLIQETGLVDDAPETVIDQIYVQSAETMEQLPDSSVALMVTSPPYNVGKDCDEDLSLEEYLGLLERVFAETYRVLEAGGRVAVNVANVGRKPYLALNHHVAGMLGDTGFLLRGEIIWQKAKAAGGSTAWGSWQSAKNPTLRGEARRAPRPVSDRAAAAPDRALHVRGRPCSRPLHRGRNDGGGRGRG